MHRVRLSNVLLTAAAFVGGASQAGAQQASNWPGHRGPDGRAVSRETGLPVNWSTTDNVRWKTALPGTGHSSPIVWGDRIFLTTAIRGDKSPGHSAVKHDIDGQPYLHPDATDADFEHQYRLLAIDTESGAIVWNTLAAERAPYDDRHRAGSFASPTPVTDGERVYAYFGSPGLYAYDYDGNLLWDAQIGEFATLGMGVASSPVLYEDLIIIQADSEFGEDSFIVALDKRTGQQVWKTSRQVQVSWTTPLLVSHNGRAELITNGNEWLVSYDPATGQTLWQLKGLESNAIHSPLVHDDLVILTAGYPSKIIKAVRLGGSGDLTGTDYLAWTYNKGTAYVPSNIVYGDYLYLLADNGVVTCLNASTGAVVYLGGRMPVAQRFFSSPVAYEDRVLIAGQDGDVFVVKAGENFEVVASNSLGESIWAAPAISQGKIFIRTLDHLWAIERTP